MDEESSNAPMVTETHRYITSESTKVPQYLVTLAANLAVLSGSTIIGWTSPALPELMSKNSVLPLTLDQASWASSLMPIGAFIGALPAGAIADILGRKVTIMAMSFPLMVSWTMIYFAREAWMLYTARLLAGLGLGAFCTVVPMYVSEIAEDKIKGTLGSVFQLMIAGGIEYSYIVGYFFHYTTLPIYCGALNVVFLLAFFKVPESPLFLLKKNRRKDAEDSLRYLRGERYNIYEEINILDKELSQDSTVPFCKSVRQRSNLKAMTICLGLMLFQQLSGINAVIFYAGSIFKEAGTELDPKVCAILVGLTPILSTIIAASLVDRLGRKILLQFSGVSMAICLFVLGYYFHLMNQGTNLHGLGVVPLLSLMTYLLTYALGFGTVPWMITGEILHPDIKGTGTGIATASNWILAFVMSKSFLLLNTALGPAVTFWIISSVCLLSFIFVTTVVVETKGKNVFQIQEELRGNKR